MKTQLVQRKCEWRGDEFAHIVYTFGGHFLRRGRRTGFSSTQVDWKMVV